MQVFLRGGGRYKWPDLTDTSAAGIFKETEEQKHESNRNRAPHRRSGPGGHSQGDPAYHAHPGGRPVTDNIGTVGKILLCHAGSVKKVEDGLYIVTEDEGESVRIREGWNGGK